MKKILAILVAVAMTLSVVTPAFAASYSDVSGNSYQTAIEHLSGLGLVAGYEDGTYQPAKVVTRAEIAKLLVTGLGLQAGADILKGESKFADVSTSHWAIGYINVATQYGLVKGDGDGNFRPDATVNYAEAATMILRALGYDRVVEKAGQWPTNYLNKANELKVFEDVSSFAGSDGAQRGALAQMLWNMLNTKMWEIVSESEGNGVNYSANKTMLQNKFPDFNTLVGANIVTNFVDSKIQAVRVNDATSIAVDFGTRTAGVDGVLYTGDDVVTVTDTVIYKNVSKVERFVIGAEAEALYTKNKDNEKIGASLTIDKSLTVSGMITKVDTANDKVTINGKEYTYTTGDIFAKFDIVEVALNKDTKKIENKVTAYTAAAASTILVKEVKTASNGDVTYVAETGTGSNIVVPKDNKVIFLDMSGKVYAQSEVVAGMSIQSAVTTVADKSFVYVSNATVTGKVTAIDEANAIVTVDSVEYKVASDARVKYEGKTTHEALSANGLSSLIGNTASFKLDTLGQIVFVGAPDTVISDNYAFVLKSWSESVEGVTTYKVRLMGFDGKVNTYETYNFDADVKKSVELAATRVDGGDGKLYSGDDVVTSLVTGAIVKFELKDGKVAVATDDGLAVTLVPATFVNTGDVKYSVKAPAAITGLNKTSKTFVQGVTIAYNTNTKFIEYVVKAADYKVETGSFNAADLDGTKNYVVVYDATSKVASEILYLNAGTTLATKNYGVIVTPTTLVGMEGTTKVYATKVFDVKTNTEVTLNTGDTSYAFAKGSVVTYSESTTGKYEIVAAVAVGTAVDGADAGTVVDYSEAGDNYVLDTTAVGDTLMTKSAKVLFVNAAGEVETNKTIDDILTPHTIYGAEKMEKASVGDTDVYTTIVVKI